MNHPLFSLITTAAIVLTSAFAGTASAADSYDLMLDCSVPTYYLKEDKCTLSIALASDAKTALKKVIFRVNGKPVYAAYNDKSPLQFNNFGAFSVTNAIPVTCGKTYTVTAHVVKAASTAETKVGEPQPVICPAKATF